MRNVGWSGRMGIAMALIASLAGCAVAGTAPRPADVRQCSMVEVSRDSLRLEDGRFLYVEASAFVADERGRVLLAGVPNIRTTVSPEDEVTDFEKDAVFGAVIERDGSARAVDVPIGGARLGGIRAAPAAGGGWHVVFGQVAAFLGDDRPDTTSQVWYGRYDGERWSDVEPLPFPQAGTVFLRLSSSLAVGGDTLAWASYLFPTANGASGLALFQRQGGAWSSELLQIPHSQSQPVFLPDRGLALLVVGGAFDRGPTDSNSLLLWTRTPDWRMERRLVHGPTEGDVSIPAIAVSPSGWSTSWHTGSFMGEGEQRALVGTTTAAELTPVVLDRSAWWTQYPNAAADLEEVHVWFTEHGDDEDRRELRFVTHSDTSAVLLGTIPSPYFMPEFTRATGAGPRDLLVTGAHVARARILSVLIRARLQCAVP